MKKNLKSAARRILMGIMDERQEEIIESATDWICLEAVDLRGKRPREETRKMVAMAFLAYKKVLFDENFGGFHELINKVITFRGPMGFRISSPQKGFLSPVKVIWRILNKLDYSGEILLEIDNIFDEIYEPVLYELSDEYQEVVEKLLMEKIKLLEEAKENLEKTVGERTNELRKRIEELENFHKLTVGRELKMIELKKELDELRRRSTK